MATGRFSVANHGEGATVAMGMCIPGAVLTPFVLVTCGNVGPGVPGGRP